MPTSVQVPTLGESVTEAVLTQWLKKDGDHVAVDEPICELESDKATVDLPAPASGVLHQILPAGETAHVGDVIAKIDEDKAADRAAPEKATTTQRGSSDAAAPDGNGAKAAKRGATAESPQQPKIATKETWKVASAAPSVPPLPASSQKPRKQEEPTTSTSPAKPTVAAAAPPSTEKSTAGQASSATQPAAPQHVTEDGIRREPMSKIRRSIAERLVRAQQTTAMLTTFNEIDMTAVQELRSRYKEPFFKEHGVPLGIVSLFARATVLALGKFPILNAQIDGGDIVYHDHVQLGVAVSTDRGLVVPVLHNVERLSVARIEQEIKRLAAAAREGKLSIGDLSGGTFTITNGGVFGSLLSTPILHPPQSGILGLHAIQERPVAINRQVEIRPMMYVALSYDHRLVDGHDAVSFLVHIKRLLEDPMQMVLGL